MLAKCWLSLKLSDWYMKVHWSTCSTFFMLKKFHKKSTTKIAIKEDEVISGSEEHLERAFENWALFETYYKPFMPRRRLPYSRAHFYFCEYDRDKIQTWSLQKWCLRKIYSILIHRYGRGEKIRNNRQLVLHHHKQFESQDFLCFSFFFPPLFSTLVPHQWLLNDLTSAGLFKTKNVSIFLDMINPQIFLCQGDADKWFIQNCKQKNKRL